MTPPLLKLDGQGNNRQPDADMTRWLLWVFFGLVGVLAALKYA